MTTDLCKVKFQTKSGQASVMFRNTFARPFNAVTWPGLLAHVPPERRNGLDLEEMLKNEIEASVFVNNPVKLQRLLLEDLFGDNSDLVEVILGLTSSQVSTDSCSQHD